MTLDSMRQMYPMVNQMIATMRRMLRPADTPRKRSQFGAVLMAFVAISIGNASYAAAAGRIFYDGLENGNTNLWAQDGVRNKCTAVQTSVDGRSTHSGNYMLECNWNGAVAWDHAASYSTLKLNSFIYSREFLVRFWVRYATDVDRVSGNKLLRLYPGNGGDSFYLAAHMDQTGGALFIFWESINGGQGPIRYGDGTAFGDGTWHEIEIYVKHNTSGNADGTLKIWQDGILKQQALNTVSASSGSRWYPLYLMSNWSSNPGWEHDANNHTYWDDIEIYSDSGTGASGLMSDGSITSSGTPPPPPPSAPTNLRIVAG